MNRILFLAGMVTLLGSAGCIVPEGGHRGYARHDEHFDGPPAVVVRAPEVVVRPPEVIVR